MISKEYYIDDDGIKLHIKLDRPDNTDKCPLVLMFHGLTGHMEEEHIAGICRQINEKLGYTTLRADLYGHAKSDGKLEDHTMLKWIDNGLKVIEHASSLDFVSDLYITGHSQGGLLTIILAGMRPDLFKAVMPLSAATNIPDGARHGDLLGISFDPDHLPESICMGNYFLKSDYLAAAQLLHPEQQMRRYHGPVLLVHGDEDLAVPISCSYEAQKEYADARLLVIHKADHEYIGYLDEVYEGIISFLKDVA
ncbi:MAG: alpha/beta fold hydrolase [Erysipelotrichaceae bacterium]|nr:alpha/beta fold hydrolase [Erysipelotrichaceae bacterium]